MRKKGYWKSAISVGLICVILGTQISSTGLAQSVLGDKMSREFIIGEEIKTGISDITLKLAEGDKENGITANFTVPTLTEDGQEISWTTSNKNIIQVKKGTATVKKPSKGYANVTLTAELGNEKKNFALRVLAQDFYGFENTCIKVGDTLQAVGYEQGTTYTYKVYKICDSDISNSIASGGNRPMAPGMQEVDVTKVGTKKTLIGEPIINQTGALEIISDYNEAMIELEVEGKDTISIYVSSIPVMYINSNTAYYSIVKDEYCDIDIQMQGSEAYPYGLYTGNGEIKLRGNSTAYRPKRPFKLKLETKTDMLGLGEEDRGEAFKSKHWVLLANDIDHSLLRNKILYDFSGKIGTEFYFKSTNITLIYNGQYQGVYQLCEHRRVDEGRIEILKNINDGDAYTDWEGIGETIAEIIAQKEIADMDGLTADVDAADAFTKALEDKVLSDFSWIDSHQITLSENTYNGITIPAKTYKFNEYGLNIPQTDGGYLIEMDFYSKGNPTYASMTTAFDQPLYFSSPEPGAGAVSWEEQVDIVNTLKNTSLFRQAEKLNQSFEYALHSDDFFFRNKDVHYAAPEQAFDESGSYIPKAYVKVNYSDDIHNNMHYSEMFDMDSLVTNFIFCEFAMNWDSMKNSFFYYKKSGEPAKIGPQWDFDWCWGNKNMFGIDTWAPETWQTTNAFFSNEQYYQTQQWNRMLIRDPYFITLAYEKYWAQRATMEEIIKNAGLLDTYNAQLAAAGESNDKRWDFTYNTQFYGGWIDNEIYGFQESVKNIKNFLKIRLAWMDKQFASVETLRKSLGYYKTSGKVGVSAVEKNDKGVVLTANVSNHLAASVDFQINGTTIKNVKLNNQQAVCQIENALLKTDGLNCIEIKLRDTKGKYIYNSVISGRQSYNMVMSNYIVLDKEMNAQTVVGKVVPQKKEYTLTVGQSMVIQTTFIPANVKSPLTWLSDDFFVASVIDGKVTAKKAGTVNISFYTVDGVNGTCKVIVKNPPTKNNNVNNTTNTNKTKIKVKPATKLKVKALKKKKIKLTWKKSSNANGYVIYRSTKKKKGFKKIATIKKKTKCTYTDKKLKAGKKYYYKIKAYKKVKGAKLTSKYTKVLWAKAKK